MNKVTISFYWDSERLEGADFIWALLQFINTSPVNIAMETIKAEKGERIIEFCWEDLTFSPERLMNALQEFIYSAPTQVRMIN